MDTLTTAALLAKLEYVLNQPHQMIMTKDDALRLVKAYADVVPPDDHIRTMPDRMADHSLGKAMRWLGYVQGVLVERGVFTLDEVKEHSRMFSSDPNAKSLAPAEQTRRRTKDELLKELESLLVDAGEMCPYDYQHEFDWGTYNQMIAEVKQLFSEHCRGADELTLAPQLAGAIIKS